VVGERLADLRGRVLTTTADAFASSYALAFGLNGA
jgi:hypothetical protein